MFRKYNNMPINAIINGEGAGRKINTCEVVNNRIYFYSEIEREDILNLNRTIRETNNDLITRQVTEGITDQKIFLHIQSYGGEIFTGLSAMDEILKSFIPITTIVDGCCASAATFLSIAGKTRLINKHAFMLIHQLSSWMAGTYEEFKDNQESLDKMMNTIKEIYGTFTHIPEDVLTETLKHDVWLNANECLNYGLVDEIL